MCSVVESLLSTHKTLSSRPCNTRVHTLYMRKLCHVLLLAVSWAPYFLAKNYVPTIKLVFLLEERFFKHFLNYESAHFAVFCSLENEHFKFILECYFFYCKTLIHKIFFSHCKYIHPLSSTHTGSDKGVVSSYPPNVYTFLFSPFSQCHCCN